jgi:hypothetical protein
MPRGLDHPLLRLNRLDVGPVSESSRFSIEKQNIDKLLAISNETGEVVEDEDVYATIARPRGSGSRNELCKRHLVAALGISKKEWQDIIVGLIAPLSYAFGTLTSIDQHTPHLLPVRIGNPPRWQSNGLEAKEL